MAKRREWHMGQRQENIFNNLWSQAQKALDFRKTPQAGRGNERYREGVRSFCKHLAINYGSKNFKNISDKHLKSYVQESKRFGISDKTIKTDLSGIRKLHSLQPKTKYNLTSNNKELGVEKISSRGVDRAWKNNEIRNAIGTAKAMGRNDVVYAISIARETGTRIEEVTYLGKSDLKEALINGYLHLKNTKGGIPRDVPLTDKAEKVFREVLEEVKDSGRDKLFLGHGRTHEQARESISDWIFNHRDKFKDNFSVDREYHGQLKIDEERENLTFHGIRHAFAREQYEQRIEEGLSEKEARQEVAELLGHGRDDVTRIYLGK